mmetsp:Transcript_47871/g.113972  ORF Transcript_47871/g.113972 Transcript_47871/m.113972 type:complete len:239 (+) Transcript_47871:222-938(+)
MRPQSGPTGPARASRSGRASRRGTSGSPPPSARGPVRVPPRRRPRRTLRTSCSSPDPWRSPGRLTLSSSPAGQAAACRGRQPGAPCTPRTCPCTCPPAPTPLPPPPSWTWSTRRRGRRCGPPRSTGARGSPHAASRRCSPSSPSPPLASPCPPERRSAGRAPCPRQPAESKHRRRPFRWSQSARRRARGRRSPPSPPPTPRPPAGQGLTQARIPCLSGRRPSRRSGPEPLRGPSSRRR